MQHNYSNIWQRFSFDYDKWYFQHHMCRDKSWSFISQIFKNKCLNNIVMECVTLLEVYYGILPDQSCFSATVSQCQHTAWTCFSDSRVQWQPVLPVCAHTRTEIQIDIYFGPQTCERLLRCTLGNCWNSFPNFSMVTSTITAAATPAIYSSATEYNDYCISLYKSVNLSVSVCVSCLCSASSGLLY